MTPLLAFSATSLLVAAGSLAGAGGLVWWAYRKSDRSKPMHGYAAVSLAAHLLLLAGASLWRLGGPALPGDEDAPPVRVRIVTQTPPADEPSVDDAQSPTPLVETQPDATTPAETSDEPGETEPLVAEESPSAAAHDEPSVAQATADPAPEPPSAPTSEALPTAGDAAPAIAAAATAAAAVAKNASPSTESSPAEQPPRELTPIGAPSEPMPPENPTDRVADQSDWNAVRPSAYSARGERQRRRLAMDEGGTQETLDAVAAGVDWLARAQRPDGLWDARRWGAGREQQILNENRGGAGKHAETGLTGLALLAMGGAGHSHLDGPYQQNVARGLQALIDAQTLGGPQDGDLAGSASLYARTYCHSMATFALAEALAMTGDERLRPAVERAVGFLIRGQSRATGGWRYKPGDRGDMSQMGWVVMALRSAELGGVLVGPVVWGGIERFVASVERGRHGGLACYQPLGPTTVTMTAEALYCRQILGIANQRPAAAGEAVAQLAGQLPGGSGSNRPANLYYWYYATLALHHQKTANHAAENTWREWNGAMQRTLLPRQVGQGSNRGSWSPNTLWGGYGGRVYSTALSTMCLEVYYRYDAEQIGRDPWIASRESIRR